MKKLFILALVVAELAMVGAALPRRFSPASLAPPRPVDRKWARAMLRQADQAQREDVRKSSHRQAVEACVGPNGPSMSPGLYEAKARLCETRLAGAPADDPQGPTYPAPPPAASAQASAEAAVPPAADDVG
jgi:hypothetical protein